MSELTIKQAQEDVERFLEEWGKKWKRVDNHFYICQRGHVVFCGCFRRLGELYACACNGY